MLKADLEFLEVRASDLVCETVDALTEIKDTVTKIRKQLEEAINSLLEAQNTLDDIITGAKTKGEGEHGQIQM